MNDGIDLTLAKMIQPEALQTPKGTDIWNMISYSIRGDHSAAKKLLMKDKGLSNCSWGYFTPLHFAVRHGHIEFVKMLLDRGADATYKSGLGWQDDPLTKAKDKGDQDIADILSQHLGTQFSISPEGAAICDLIRTGRVEDVLRELDASPELIHAGDERGNTPLHWAIITRKLPLIDGLIHRGADVNAKRADGATPLQLVIEGDYWFRSNRDLSPGALRNEWFIVGYLVARGAEYDIWTAASIGDSEQVLTFLQEDPSLVNALNSIEKRPLSYAAKNGYTAMVKLLLEYGADPNARERDAPNGAALWVAVKGNYADCVELLLDHGANPNASLDASGNPLSIAVQKNYDQLVKLLYAHGASLHLDHACWLGKIDLVGEILNANRSLINSGGDYGPLCMAAGFGHHDIVKLLVKNGVDLNAPWYANNYMGYTMDKSLELAAYFLETGADPNLANWQGITYLHKAAWRGNIDFAQLLIDYGADLNSMDEEYRSTPMGWAAKYGKSEMVRFLLEQGANPHLPVGEAWAQPLSWAKRKGYTDIADILEAFLVHKK